MAKDTESVNYDYNARLAEAILLLAERVTPRPVHPEAQKAIDQHAELTRRLQFVFRETPPPSTDKY
jgi:hypothetical protein